MSRGLGSLLVCVSLGMVLSNCNCGPPTISPGRVIDGGRQGSSDAGSGGGLVVAGGAGGGAGVGAGGVPQGGGSAGGPSSGADAGRCGVITATVRDFKRGDRSDGHPDFETFGGQRANVGLVDSALGPEKKPVFRSTGSPANLTSKERFDEWYRDVVSTNMSFQIELPLTAMGQSWVFESFAFFPLDDKGFGNQGEPHNFHFTTEVHTTVTYSGGEVFRFSGDDDV